MVDLDTEVCICNSLSVNDIAECIKNNNFATLDELLNNTVCPMGDKCESCRENGFKNDGVNIPMVFSMVKRNQI